MSKTKRVNEAVTTVTLEDVGRMLFQSDHWPLVESIEGATEGASYLLKTSLGLRAMMDGSVKVDLGAELGMLTLTYKAHHV